MTCAFFFQRWA